MKVDDRSGLEELYVAYYPRLVAELTAMSGSREVGEDCASEAFTRLVLHWKKVSRHGQPVAWLRTVGYRLAIDSHRRSRRLSPLTEAPDDPATPGPHERGHREIWQAVLELPPTQREVVIRHAAHGLTDAEIADDLRVPIGTIKSRLARARSALRSQLGEQP